MAIVRVDVKEHFGVGEIWVDAENETAAVEEVRRWCDANAPWELRGMEPVRGKDGNYKFSLEREVRPEVQGR